MSSSSLLSSETQTQPPLLPIPITLNQTQTSSSSLLEPMAFKEEASRPRPTSSSEGIEKRATTTPPTTQSPQTAQTMPKHTTTRTEHEKATSPSQIVEGIVANLQATHEEPIASEGDRQEASQAKPPVSL